SGCFCISDHSALVRLAGLSRIASGTASLPMSWNRAAWPSRSSSAWDRTSSRPTASARRRARRGGPAELAADRERELLDPARVTGGVGVAGIDRRRQRLHRCGRALLEQAVCLLQGDILRLNRLGRLTQLLGALLGVAEVWLLRLAHQGEQERQHGECPEVRRVVAEEADSGDEAVDEVVRHEPGKAF